MEKEITQDLLAIGIISIAVAIFLLRIHIAKTKLVKKNPVDLERVKQELKNLRYDAERLEWNMVLGYISDDVYQKNMAKIDARVKEIETMIHGAKRK